MTFDIDEFLKKAKKANASDIHLNCNKVPSLRIAGEIYKISTPPLTKDDIYEVLEKTLPQEYLVNIEDIKNIDYIYEIKDVSRYRVNYCKDIQRGKFTFRTIPYEIKTFEQLNLPDFLKTFTEYNNGIVFITGATGSGKSTTLASMIELINQNRKNHIITIEDPIEFVYEDKKSIITQRSLEIDVKDFHTGIKYALRQDPDVLLVGEIRDKDTLLAAIEASETGHLVFSTLHTNSTVATINRLLGFIDENAQEDFLKRLSCCVRGVIHQQLVPTKEGNALHPAFEILTFTPTVCDYVKNGKLHDVEILMQRSKQQEIITLNSYLFKLVEQDIITPEIALENSLEKTELRQMFKGVFRNTETDQEPLL